MAQRTASPSAAFGIVTLLLTLAGWSSVPLFLRHFAGQIDLWTSNGWRYGFSAVLWAPVLMIVAANRRLPAGLWRAAIVPSLANATGQICFTWAHYRIDPGLLTFGLRSQLLFVAIGAWLLFPQERPILRHRGYLLGATLLILGVVGVMGLDSTAGAVGDAAPLATGAVWGTKAAHVEGVALAIGSGLLFACYGLAVRKSMAGINSVIAFAAICQYTAAAMVVLMLLLGQSAGMTALRMSGGQFALLLLSAVIGIAVGHVFYYMSLARLGVAVTAGVLQLQPFLVAVASIWRFDESLGAGQWISGLVAVFGAMLMLLVQWRLSQRARISDKPLAIAEGESGA